MGLHQSEAQNKQVDGLTDLTVRDRSGTVPGHFSDEREVQLGRGRKTSTWTIAPSKYVQDMSSKAH